MWDSYWFGFLLQVAGIAVAAWVVVSVFGLGRRGAYAVAVGGVALALLGGQYAIGIRPAIDHLRSIDDKFAVTDQASGRTWCVNEPGLPDLNFLRFIQSRVPDRARYELFLPEEQRRMNVSMCIALVLAPRVEVSDPSRAQWRVFFGEIPEAYRDQATAANPAYQEYAPAMGVLEVGG